MTIIGKKDERNKSLIDDVLSGNGMSYKDAGDKYGISRQRVLQILYEYGITDPRNQLTKKLAQKLYDYICEYKEKNDGRSPGISLMVKGSKLGTISRVRRALNYLQHIGMIDIVIGRKINSDGVHTVVDIVGAKWMPPKNREVG